MCLRQYILVLSTFVPLTNIYYVLWAMHWGFSNERTHCPCPHEASRQWVEQKCISAMKGSAEGYPAVSETLFLMTPLHTQKVILLCTHFLSLLEIPIAFWENILLESQFLRAGWDLRSHPRAAPLCFPALSLGRSDTQKGSIFIHGAISALCGLFGSSSK